MLNTESSVALLCSNAQSDALLFLFREEIHCYLERKKYLLLCVTIQIFFYSIIKLIAFLAIDYLMGKR